ncbi:MAG TPA: sugar ABC transporter ATP-binding protein [Bryobacteraceae bacterium]|jgi:ABC-type sugar transport system ATPase subunit
MLEAANVSKRYGGVQALRDARLSVAPGEVHALVGENGAGKSTLARIVAGVEKPDGGSIRVDARPAMIYQELDLFPSLTVAENLQIVGTRDSSPWLDMVGLRVNPRRALDSLSIAERQLVAIARALSQQSQILLMDEPTSSLADPERLFALIGDLKRRGVAIVYVSHKMNEIFRLSDRITVMRDGAWVATLETASTTPAELVRLMVGRAIPEQLSRKGEILGLAGLVGSGRSTRLRSFLTSDAALVPEDRQAALFPQLSVLENVTISRMPQRLGFIRASAERVTPLPIPLPNLHAPVSTLSGGNQQKALLARALLLRPKVLLLDDPTRGIDIAAKQEIYRLIEDLAAQGTSIVLVSSELEELLRLCGRIEVLHEGRVAATFDAAQATQEKIMGAATGSVA